MFLFSPLSSSAAASARYVLLAAMVILLSLVTLYIQIRPMPSQKIQSAFPESNGRSSKFGFAPPAPTRLVTEDDHRQLPVSGYLSGIFPSDSVASQLAVKATKNLISTPADSQAVAAAPPFERDDFARLTPYTLKSLFEVLERKGLNSSLLLDKGVFVPLPGQQQNLTSAISALWKSRSSGVKHAFAVAIISSRNDIQVRQVLRDTLLQRGEYLQMALASRKECEDRPKILWRFFIGFDGNKDIDNEMEQRLEKEQMLFGDVIVVPFAEGKDNLTRKRKESLLWATKLQNGELGLDGSFEFFMMMDTDSFIRFDLIYLELRSLIDQRTADKTGPALIWGKIITAKWEKFLTYSYPAGPGFAMTPNVLDVLSNSLETTRADYKYPFDDVAVGKWILHARLSMTERSREDSRDLLTDFTFAHDLWVHEWPKRGTWKLIDMQKSKLVHHVYGRPEFELLRMVHETVFTGVSISCKAHLPPGLGVL